MMEENPDDDYSGPSAYVYNKPPERKRWEPYSKSHHNNQSRPFRKFRRWPILPLILEIPAPPPPTHLSPIYTQTDSILDTIKTIHILSGNERFWSCSKYFEKTGLFESNHSNHGQVPKVVLVILGYRIRYYLVLTYVPYLTAVQAGSLISLLSHFCRDLMQVNPTAVRHMMSQLQGKRNDIITESKCWFSYCFWRVLLSDHII